MTQLRASGATDVGLVRETNQDQLLLSDDLFAVADGMGGHAAGEVAALVAVEALEEAFDGERTLDSLRQAVRLANQAVWRRGQSEPDLAGMGTTLTAVALVAQPGPTGESDDTLAVANVGDSRTYLLRDGELSLLTYDHSWVQEMVRAGQMRPEDADRHPKRSTLTRALGIGADVDVDVTDLIPYAGDRLLLCSDGLWDELGDDEIARILLTHTDPDDAAAELVEAANHAGGRDNITVVVLDVVDDDDRAGRASAALADVPETAAAKAEPTTALGDDAAEPAAPQAAVPAPVREAPLARPSAATPVPAVKHRRFTGRVILFLVALAMLVVAAIGSIIYFGSHSYYVALDETNVVAIYKGRPGGFLWMGSKRVEQSQLLKEQVPPQALPDLAKGKAFSSRSAAQTYITNLGLEAAREGRITTGGGTVRTLAPGETIPATSSPSTPAGSTTTLPGVTTAPPPTPLPGG